MFAADEPERLILLNRFNNQFFSACVFGLSITARRVF
ncbi:hypothetical protein ACVILH_003980 [Bradyrhizobium sp. USDA 4353]